jgi:hypothetical protein
VVAGETPSANVIKLFFLSSLILRLSKLEYLSLPSLTGYYDGCEQGWLNLIVAPNAIATIAT